MTPFVFIFVCFYFFSYYFIFSTVILFPVFCLYVACLFCIHFSGKDDNSNSDEEKSIKENGLQNGEKSPDINGEEKEKVVNGVDRTVWQPLYVF